MQKTLPPKNLCMVLVLVPIASGDSSESSMHNAEVKVEIRFCTNAYKLLLYYKSIGIKLYLKYQK